MPYTVTINTDLFTKLKKKSVALLLFFIGNVSIAQFQSVRDKVLPLFIHHPRFFAIATSLFGLALMLYRPHVQEFLKRVDGQGPTVPVEPGAQLDEVKVVQPKP